VTESVRSIRHAGQDCEVLLGRNLVRRIPDLTAAWPSRFAVIGEGFHRLHEEIGEHLAASEIQVIVVRDGESAKTLSGVEAIVTELLARGARRDATIIAVGGGVIGDMVGFASAVFLRGVRLVHVPTTLLAQVDSSIGGKTAVNHPMGKNLVGAFHPAAKVISDVSVLSTLPETELLSGAFEALKSGVIGDADLFSLCVDRRSAILAAQPEVLEEVVHRSVAVKAAIVEADERESDLRKLLNYGHTIGHGIEAALGFRNLTHGEAVAWGMLGANVIAVARGILSENDARRIDDAILAFAPRATGPLEPDDIFAAIRHDKKFSSAGMVMALPSAIGNCQVVEGIREDEVREGIAAVLGLSAQSG